MAQLLVLTPALGSDVLPALGLLAHSVRQFPASPETVASLPTCEVVLVDARTDLAHARSLCRLLTTAGADAPVLLVVTESAFAAVTAEWGTDDMVLATAGPGEVDARIRLAVGRRAGKASSHTIRASGLVIDEDSYSAKANGRLIDLTYKEFELLRFLASHPSRVFTREQLLSEVWGYDYFGGTRTVDVHVRRLRAKLGDQEALIGTVRNVGYRFTAEEFTAEDSESAGGEANHG